MDIIAEYMEHVKVRHLACYLGGPGLSGRHSHQLSKNGH